MTSSHGPAFQAFVSTQYAEFLRDLGAALATPLAILDAAGMAVCRPAEEEIHPQPAQRRAAGLPHPQVINVTAPIVCHGERLGSLVAYGARPELQEMLVTMAEQIGERFRLETDLDRMTDQLAQSYDEINLLYGFARLLRPEESFGANAKLLLDETADLLEHRLLVLHQSDPPLIAWSAGPGLRLDAAQHWATTAEAAVAEFERSASATDAVPGTRRPGVLQTPHGSVHYVVCPVRMQERFVGYVGVVRTTYEPFFETGELRLVECLAAEMGNAAVAQRLNRELRDLLFHTVRSLVAAIDAKDEYTRGHSERVFHLSRALGRRLGISAEDEQTLSWAALLHDIGKIALQGAVLTKPGRLSAEEFALVRGHPERGCRVLDPIPQLRAVLPGIRHHHERLDGRGYPDGLRGEEIPFIARIIAVADAYDAITSTRSYHEARSQEEAIARISADAGTQFDPQVVGALLELAAEGTLADILSPADTEDAATAFEGVRAA